MALEPWETWAKHVQVRSKSEPRQGKKLLEETARSLGISPTTLPWHRFGRKGAT